ncbi:MAG TPA: M67 family metallopeptidase [Thermoanaerobaculia bacterium]|jgi:proteasome lid subunit RPN8/RPN11
MTCPTIAPQPAGTDLHLAAELRHELAAWAELGHPHETCGLLVGRAGEGRVEVVRVAQAKNLNRERASDRYELDPADFLAADRAARVDGLEIVGFWHSHPDCPARPSTRDLEAAWEGYSYLIVGVTAAGETDFHSWRLYGDRFREEKVLPEQARPTAAALRFENPLKEERVP